MSVYPGTTNGDVGIAGNTPLTIDRDPTGRGDSVWDEPNLAWFYVAPGVEGRESCRRLLKLARDLLGSRAWVVLQAGDAQCLALCRELGLHIIESYQNQAPGPNGVSLHLVQTS